MSGQLEGSEKLNNKTTLGGEQSAKLLVRVRLVSAPPGNRLYVALISEFYSLSHCVLSLFGRKTSN